MKKRLVVFDIEVLANIFICCVRFIDTDDTIVFEISGRKNELDKLIEFFTSDDYIFVGYNCSHYDTPIVNMLIKHRYDFGFNNYLEITEACKRLSDMIIDRDTNPKSWSVYKFANYFLQIDVMTMMASKALRVGLKPLQVSMCYWNVEEMQINWNEWLHPDRYDDLIGYCHNDTGSTKSALQLMKSDLELRLNIKKEFGVDCLSKDGVGIGVDIFTKFMCEDLNLYDKSTLFQMRDNYDVIRVKDFILPQINVTTEPFKRVVNHFQSLVLNAYGKLNDSEDEAAITVISKQLQHTFALGGVHSINRPRIVDSDDRYAIIDIDVASMYPAMSIEWNFGPRGFKEAFTDRLRAVRDQRIIAKRNKEATKDKVYKLLLNSLLGNLRNEYSPYFAPEANVAICINGQLFIAMLIERVEALGAEVILSNTDGICIKIERNLVDKLHEVCKDWSDISKLELEFVEYDRICMLAVNDYVAFKKGYKDKIDTYDFPRPEQYMEYNFAIVRNTYEGNNINDLIKTKGFFIPYPRIGKGLESLIIAKAIINYLGKGIPPEITVNDFQSIHDYLIYQKVDRKYEVRHGNEKQQHINRYYVSRGAPYLLKCEKQGAKEKCTNLLKGQGVRIANKLLKDDTYKINYRYYITKAQEIIDKIEPKQLSLF